MNHPPDWLQGLFTVLPTPMVAGGGLDLHSLDRVVDYYLEGGAAGLVPVSVAGEGDRLDGAERRCVMQRVVQRSGGRAPVIAGILAGGLEAALAQAGDAAECGVDGLLIKPPEGSEHAVIEYFAAIGQARRLPIVVLDHPAFGPRMSVELIGRLAGRVPEVCAIKLEDEPTADKMARLRAVVGVRMRIFGGSSGAHCLQELAHGADGFFTGCPHPELLVKTMACFRQGDQDGASAAFESLRHVIARERQQPGAMVGQRKAILHELGVLSDAATR